MHDDRHRHPSLRIEAKDSWELHRRRLITESRLLKKHHKKKHHKKKKKKKEQRDPQEIKREKKLKELYDDSGIQIDTMHGMMIDAGSSGSRMHVYEFEPRILEGQRETSLAVAGKKLSYPGTDSRWTERLRPGIANFASLSDDQLFPAIAEYLRPLMEFAETVLHTKTEYFHEYPIYLKATAGMRILQPQDRARVINACRAFFSNSTYSKFKFQNDYARVISGEEEAIYGWAGANFVLGSLLKSSEGSGTVMNPELTYGTVELGGASSQIAFYQSNEDIMSNLFKLQIGQGKHWNVYAHSFLYFGINEAWNRMGAYVSTISNETIVLSKVQNPCLVGDAKVDFESTIYFIDGHESFQADKNGKPLSCKTTLVNDASRGSYDGCSAIVKSLMNKRYNTWCNFEHHGDCSFTGVYQPQLPQQSQTFGEFIAFSGFYDVFSFLHLPNRSTLRALQNATMHLCSMNSSELEAFNGGRLGPDDLVKTCFQSVYAFELLSTGIGFHLDDNITATDVVNGQKIGWALGSMLYEINTLPWLYVPKKNMDIRIISSVVISFVGIVIIFASFGLYCVYKTRSRHNYSRLYSLPVMKSGTD